jgi:hypothetical protein
VALRFSNSHFCVQNSSLFDVQPLGLLYSENDVSGIATEKTLYQNVEKTPFFGIFNQIAAPEPKIEKIAPMH